MAAAPPKILSQYFLTILDKDTIVDGSVIPKGTTILFAPQTTAHSVRVPGGKSLLEAWPTISKTDHKHYELENLIANYQSEQIAIIKKLTQLEMWAIDNGYNPDNYALSVKDINSLSLYEYNYGN